MENNVGSKPTIIRLLTVGGAAVGKSSLLLCYAHGQFNREYMPTIIGIDFRLKTLEDLDGHCVKVQLWDTAGQEHFRNANTTYNRYRGAGAIVVVYDVTCRLSFDKVRTLVAEARANAKEDCVIVLVANKCDDGTQWSSRPGAEGNAKRYGETERDNGSFRTVDTLEGQALASELGIEYYEASAKTGQGVQTTFDAVARRVVQRQTAETHAAPVPIPSGIPDAPQPSTRRFPRWIFWTGVVVGIAAGMAFVRRLRKPLLF
jgi:small GTP-binding protein